MPFPPKDDMPMDEPEMAPEDEKAILQEIIQLAKKAYAMKAKMPAANEPMVKPEDEAV